MVPTVVVIDSGVHASHPHVQGVHGGLGIDDDGRAHDDYLDRLGHGTAVTAAIREKAPAARVWCVKVFDRDLTTTGRALVAAIRWAREHDAHFVNLSLGTTNTAHEEALAAEVAAAHAAGVVVVSAAPEGGRRWLPGALPHVVCVQMDMRVARDACEVVSENAGTLTMRASGYPRPIPGVPPERNLKGISFAVANVTGILASAWPGWREALRPRQGRY